MPGLAAVDVLIDPLAEALARAARGELLTIEDMALIWRISRATFERHARRGAFDKFRAPTIGRPRYRGALVHEHVTGRYHAETFAAKRAARR